MMKRILFALLVLLQAGIITAQQNTSKHKIAIFTPLYLDSAFDQDNEYRYARNTFPKFINPGLEFYEGAQLAIDSLNRSNIPLEVFVYDTRSVSESITDQLVKAEKAGVELIIVHANSSEVKLFGDAGLKLNIPVINVNLPNDGGISANPFFVVLNPTLKTQCEGIYNYIQKFFATAPIIVFKKNGQLEDRIRSYFEEYGKNTTTSPLRMKFVNLPDSFTLNQLRSHLDTITTSVCIAGSLDESFGKRLTQQLASLKKQKFQSIVVGMPTWDNINDFHKPEYKGIDIVYSTPFYNAKTDRVSTEINNHFNRVMFARPSDMVFRGYEVVLRFSRLLNQYGPDVASNLSNRQGKVFTDFDIQPVLGKPGMTLEYFENKKLYFLKWQDGVLKGVY